MAEFCPDPVVTGPAPDQNLVHHLSTQERLAAGMAFALAAGLGVTACGGGQPNTAETVTVTASPTTTAAAEQACGGPIKLSADRADTVYGDSKGLALFPSFQTKPDAKGNQKLLAPADAAAALRTQLRNDVRVLGVFDAYFMQTRATEQLPDTGTLASANTLIKTYQTNQERAAEDLTKACAAVQPDFMLATNNFAVTRGQAMEVQAVRGKTSASSNGLVGVKTQEINATQNLSGFELGFNKDDTSLSDTQKSIYQKLSNLILITKDGKIDINETFGPTSIKIDETAKNTASATISPNATNKVTSSPSPKQEQQNNQNQKNNNNNSGTSNANNGAQTGIHTGGKSNGGGVNVGEQGCGHAGHKNCGGGSGSNTGNKGPKGPGTGGGGGSTPTERPTTQPAPAPTTTHPETTPPPAPTPPPTAPPTVPPPSETTPPPPPPPPTTPPVKPPVSCDPNIYQC